MRGLFTAALLVAIVFAHTGAAQVRQSEETAGARPIEDPQAAAPRSIGASAPDSPGAAVSPAYVAAVAQFYASEQTATVALEQMPELMRQINARNPAPARLRVRPQGATNQMTSPDERKARSVRFDVPEAKVVNPSPYFRFIPVER
jgi:hypothetical protein